MLSFWILSIVITKGDVNMDNVVKVKAESTEPSRALWLIKWLLLFPHFIVLFFLFIGFGVSLIISFFAILFTGKYPKALFNYNVGVMRWGFRVGFYSYVGLGTDKYPPFTLKSVDDYPADIEVAYPEKLSHLLILVKMILLVPHFIAVSILSSLMEALVSFIAIILLFTGKYNQNMFTLLKGIYNWYFRVMAYCLMMTDEYPPFSFD